MFGPDARLKLHNAAFARIWELEEDDLAGRPDVQKLAKACWARFGEEASWKRLIASIASGAERRRDWGEIERSDKTIFALSLAPLPDGATLVTSRMSPTASASKARCATAPKRSRRPTV